ncbi:MAG: hypothetical protein JWQ44_1414 [Chthoniobacter sp.]|nr:hypothetical protein [Chthoniobacter sp.]
MSQTQRLIRQTARRQVLVSFGRSFHLALLIAAGAYACLLFSSRLLALLPNWFQPLSLLVIPGLAFAGALVVLRRPSPRETARLIDARSGSKELFLTAVLADDAPGEFQPVVVQQAEQRATTLRADKLLPFQWQRGARDGALTFAMLGLGVLFLPQLDPFKKEAARQKVSAQEQRLIATQKLTEVRRAEIAEQPATDSEQVKQALAQLEKTFKQAKPLEREANLKQLGEHQKEIGELWRKVSNDQLRNALDKSAQSFGQADPKKLEQWREELKRGDLSGVKKELEAIREQMKQLAEQPDSAEKRAAQEQLAQKLNQLANGMKQLADSPKVNAALARALEQMDLAKLGQLSKDGMKAAMDSLNLTQQELDQLAQGLKDGKQLEEALKNLQMAKQLADGAKLDGGECKECNGMGDYAKLFAAKMGSSQEPGQGMAGMGPGIGNGAKRPEDDSVETGFKTEKATSQLSGGKMLLEWKTAEVGETGARTEEYREAVQQVKQGVSEAIQQEQVPPGYHDTIKRYFDTLPEKK